MNKSLSNFASLPGIEKNFRQIQYDLEHIWDDLAGNKESDAHYSHATQANLIIVLDIETQPSEAVEIFNNAVLFAQRYPCRIIVICNSDKEQVSTKLFSQCYIGANLRDQCCCEAIITEAPATQKRLLESIASIWLSADLPNYLWTHKIDYARIAQNNPSFMLDCKRVIIDSKYDPFDESSTLKSLKDLATSRILPFRQGFGHALSALNSKETLSGIQKIYCKSSPEFFAEMNAFIRWVKLCIHNYDKNLSVDVELIEDASLDEFYFEFSYSEDNKKLYWDGKHLTTKLKDKEHRQVLLPKRLSPEDSLAEAVFFCDL